MPGLRAFKTSFYSSIFANEPAGAGTIKLGCVRGRGSSTRMFNYCHQHSSTPSLCIDQFITINSPNLPSDFYLIASNLISNAVCIIYDNKNNLYVSIDGQNGNSGIFKISHNKISLFANTSFIATPVAFAFNQDYSKMYVVGFTENSIYEIDMNTQSIINTIVNNNLNGDKMFSPNGLCFDSTFTNLYITNIKDGINGYILKIDLSSYNSGTHQYTSTKLYDNVSTPILIAYNLKNNCLYYTSFGNNCVYQLSLTGQNSIYINNLSEPRGICFDNNYNFLYITNYNPNGNTPNNINYISKYNVQNPSNPIFETNIVGNVLNKPRGLCFNNFNKRNLLVLSNFAGQNIYQYKVSQNIV